MQRSLYPKKPGIICLFTIKKYRVTIGLVLTVLRVRTINCSLAPAPDVIGRERTVPSLNGCHKYIRVTANE